MSAEDVHAKLESQILGVHLVDNLPVLRKDLLALLVLWAIVLAKLLNEVLEILIKYDNRQKFGACTKIILTDREEIAKARVARMKKHLAFGNTAYKNN